jgi:hypothetical protein
MSENMHALSSQCFEAYKKHFSTSDALDFLEIWNFEV